MRIATDAASRGLKAALIERNDFAEAQQQSTKLVHGGVAIWNACVARWVQYNLVRDGLRERSVFIKNAQPRRRLPLIRPLSLARA